MKIEDVEKRKENIRNQVNYYHEEGDIKSYDSYVIAVIELPDHNNERIEILVVVNQFFDVLNNMSMATMISKGNPIIKKGIDENTIYIKKNVFLAMNEEELEALIQHEITHHLLGHKKHNLKDESICLLMNLENEPILNNFVKKWERGEIELYTNDPLAVNKKEDGLPPIEVGIRPAILWKS